MADKKPTIARIGEVERPAPSGGNALFGSDAIAEVLRDLGIPYVALNPGASFRGLHDSLVNHLGNSSPQMLLCLHEEHAVAIAQGYAKVTGRAIAAIVHSNVGLFHATMAIFNAWCDRMPAIVLGATGPVDASARRPWIEWIHTARDQGAIVRPYVKWDDQPASVPATREALLRANQLAHTAPMGPVYINLDVGLQEDPLEKPLTRIDPARFLPAEPTAPTPAQIGRIVEVLRTAKSPVILAGRASRDIGAWNARIKVAETFGARVLTDLKVGASFPTDHPLHAGSPGIYVVPEARAVLASADVILSLDWVDLAGTLKLALDGRRPEAKIISITLDHVLHNGWSMDHQALPPVDVNIQADPDQAVLALADATTMLPVRGPIKKSDAKVQAPMSDSASAPLTIRHVAMALDEVVGDRPISLVHLPLGWDGAFRHFRHPLDFIGSDGGGGIGGGPGIAVGAALALRGTDRIAVCIGGDGDFLMGATAIWTAVHYRIPLLYIVANNQSFYNDEVHQERVARMRGRPVENKWIGQRMSDPEIDLAGLARSQGAVGIGPISRSKDMVAALRKAVSVVDQGGVALIDARVEAGYTPAMATSLTRSTKSENKE